MPSKTSQIRWTMSSAAREFGVSWETIARGLRQLDVPCDKGSTFTTKQIYTALAGDLKYERTREVRARADAQELENAKAKGELFTREVVKEELAALGELVRQAILMGRAELPNRANPMDPKTARIAYDAWACRFWPEMRQKIMEQESK